MTPDDRIVLCLFDGNTGHPRLGGIIDPGDYVIVHNGPVQVEQIESITLPDGQKQHTLRITGSGLTDTLGKKSYPRRREADQ